MRNMSFALTTEQIRQRSKTVTRRVGWLHLKPGEQIRAVKKCMGLRPGEKLEPLAVLRVVSVRREPLRALLDDEAYAREEIRAEGFDWHDWHPSTWIAMFCGTHKGCTPETEVTRIEFAYEQSSNAQVQPPAAREEN